MIKGPGGVRQIFVPFLEKVQLSRMWMCPAWRQYNQPKISPSENAAAAESNRETLRNVPNMAPMPQRPVRCSVRCVKAAEPYTCIQRKEKANFNRQRNRPPS